MTRAAILVGCALALSGTARADIWQDAVRGGPEPSRLAYDSAMRLGDELTLQANAASISRTTVSERVTGAIKAYRLAASHLPTSGEPYFRIADVLNSFYLETCGNPQIGIQRSPLRDCSRPDALDRDVTEQVIKAWDMAQKLAPLDPRFGGNGFQNILFDRAILHTKLATQDHLAAAARDYELLIRRIDGMLGGYGLDMLAWGNLAETHMMLGNLDDSISAYRRAVQLSPRTSTVYGLAVALDRDGRATQARDLIESYGRAGYLDFRKSVDDGESFYVPFGEVYYYFALAEEVLNRPEEAIEHFERFVRSGAHPQFHARAKEHIDALKKLRGKPPIPIDALRGLR